jgi:pimeloyl-ACP methyl ester carboxylesterase
MMELHNARVTLALHTLQSGEGVPLLLLHELGGSAADFRTAALGIGIASALRGGATLAWPGPVHALDLSGHGHSGRVYGGGYYPELWAADADIALAALGEAVVLGAGLGAYVALLLAGGRPAQVRGAVLCPGAGLAGGGPEPRFPPELSPPDIETTPRAQALQPASRTDAAALAGQDLYVRPPQYAGRFAAAARRIVLLEDGAPRPEWWHAVREVTGVARCDGSMQAALAMARAAL